MSTRSLILLLLALGAPRSATSIARAAEDEPPVRADAAQDDPRDAADARQQPASEVNPAAKVRDDGLRDVVAERYGIQVRVPQAWHLIAWSRDDKAFVLKLPQDEGSSVGWAAQNVVF